MIKKVIFLNLEMIPENNLCCCFVVWAAASHGQSYNSHAFLVISVRNTFFIKKCRASKYSFGMIFFFFTLDVTKCKMGFKSIGSCAVILTSFYLHLIKHIPVLILVFLSYCWWLFSIGTRVQSQVLISV